MTDEKIEAIDPELAQLLKRGAPAATPPAGVEERLMARLAESIPGLGGGEPGGGGGGAAPAAGATKIAIGAVVAATGALAVALTLGSGPATAPSTPAESPRAAAAPAAMPAAPPSAAGAIEPATPGVSIDDLPSAPSRPVPAVSSAERSAPPAERDDRIAEERRLLDGARRDLGRGDADTALATLVRHEQQFPAGTLAEERDALRIKALAALGREAEARGRAARFRATYPSSLFSPAVEAASSRGVDP